MIKNKSCNCGICGICTGKEEIHSDDLIQPESKIITEYKTVWGIHTIDEVLDYFVKNFALPENEKIINCENFLDTNKGKVAFCLTVETSKTID